MGLAVLGDLFDQLGHRHSGCHPVEHVKPV
jgi:hypothetical protein